MYVHLQTNLLKMLFMIFQYSDRCLRNMEIWNTIKLHYLNLITF